MRLREPESEPPVIPRRALLVAPEPPVDDPLIQVLDQLDLAHRWTRDWTVAGELLFDRIFSVVLIDSEVPGVPGKTLARSVKELVTPSPTVLFLSWEEREALASRASAMGLFGGVSRRETPDRWVPLLQAAQRDFEQRVRERRGVSSRPLAAEPPRPPPPDVARPERFLHEVREVILDDDED